MLLEHKLISSNYWFLNDRVENKNYKNNKIVQQISMRLQRERVFILLDQCPQNKDQLVTPKTKVQLKHRTLKSESVPKKAKTASLAR